MTCFDIHTHHVPLHSGQAIVSHAIGSVLPGGSVAYLSVGIHPWYLDAQAAESQLAILRQSLQDDRVVALDEVALAEEYRLPMVIHCVRAFNELIRLKKELRPRQPWIIHGYRGKESGVAGLLRHGCYISFGTKFQTEAVRAVPLHRLFIETDEAVESIADICFRIAGIKGISPEELAEAINKNVREVFFKR